jgi:hypothetical protein
MRAIRVPKKRGYAVHWLTDDEATRCGKDVAGMTDAVELDLEELPPLEACGSCNRATLGWSKPASERFVRQTAESRSGTFSRAGKLHRGPRGGHGHAIR